MFSKETRLDEYIKKESYRKIADLREEIKKDNEKYQNELKNDLNANFDARRCDLEKEYKRKNLSFDKIIKICLILIFILTVTLTFTHCHNKTKAENEKLKEYMSKIKTNTYQSKSEIRLYDKNYKKITDFFSATSINPWDNYFVLLEKNKKWSKIHFDKKDYFIRTKDLKNTVKFTIDLR